MRRTTKGQLKAFFFSGSVGADTAGTIVDSVVNGRPTGGKALAQTLFSFGGYLFESWGSFFKTNWKANEVKEYRHSNVELRTKIKESIDLQRLERFLIRQELNITAPKKVNEPWGYYTWIHNAALLFAAGCYFYEIPTTAKDEASIYPGPTASGALVFLISHVFASHKLESYLQALEQEEQELIVYGFKVQTVLLIKTIEEKMEQLAQIQQLPATSQERIDQSIQELEAIIVQLQELITSDIESDPLEQFLKQQKLAQHGYGIILSLVDQISDHSRTLIELKGDIEKLSRQSGSFEQELEQLRQENALLHHDKVSLAQENADLRAEVEALRQELTTLRHQQQTEQGSAASGSLSDEVLSDERSLPFKP